MNAEQQPNIPIPVQQAYCTAKTEIEGLLFADISDLSAQQTELHYAKRYGQLLPLVGALIFAIQIALQARLIRRTLQAEQAIDMKQRVSEVTEQLAKTSLHDSAALELALRDAEATWLELL